MSPKRLAVLGVGQALRGDDAAGIKVVQELQKRLPPSEDLMLVEAGPAPENFTGLLRRFHPDLVILVDAALMGLTPGAWRRLEWRDTTSYTGSTHTLPLNFLASYLETELGCTVELIGIQPAGNEFEAPLSPAVLSGIDSVSAALMVNIQGR